jgi:hypothetical protein
MGEREEGWGTWISGWVRNGGLEILDEGLGWFNIIG